MDKPTTLHVEKPWGSFDQYALNTPCTVKILTCNPGQKLSLQRHSHRGELWVALDPGVVLEVSLGTFDEADIERLQDDYGRR